MADDVLRFIRRFFGSEQTFTSGCCYWFAYILTSRFEDGEIVLAVIENHFLTRIHGRLYDITGDVTEKYESSVLVSWCDMDAYDVLQKERIVRDCILFLN